MTIQNISASLGEYQDDVDKTLADIRDKQVMSQIWDHNHELWKPEPTEISNRLGWLRIAEDMRANIGRMEMLVKAVRDDNYTHALLLGMGVEIMITIWIRGCSSVHLASLTQ